MITIEEMIITSLYHKMVVVNVRRTGGFTPTGGRIDGISLLLSCAQRISAAMANSAVQRQTQHSIDFDDRHINRALEYNEQHHVQLSSLVEPHAMLEVPHSSSYVTTSDSGSQTDDTCFKKKHRRRRRSHRKRKGKVTKPSHSAIGVEKDSEMETVLDTGELRLMRAENNKEESWYFGLDSIPSKQEPLSSNAGSNEVSEVQDNSGLSASSELACASRNLPAIDLTQHKEFSLIHYQDLRDPDGTSMMMITTPDSKAKKISDFCVNMTSTNGKLCQKEEEESIKQLTENFRVSMKLTPDSPTKSLPGLSVSTVASPTSRAHPSAAVLSTSDALLGSDIDKSLVEEKAQLSYCSSQAAKDVVSGDEQNILAPTGIDSIKESDEKRLLMHQELTFNDIAKQSKQPSVQHNVHVHNQNLPSSSGSFTFPNVMSSLHKAVPSQQAQADTSRKKSKDDICLDSDKFHPVCSKTNVGQYTSDTDFDSGVYDMAHGKEAPLSSRESTPITLTDYSRKQSFKDKPKHSFDDSSSACPDDGRLPVDQQPKVSYRVFHIDDESGMQEPEIVMTLNERGYLPISASTPIKSSTVEEDFTERNILLPTPEEEPPGILGSSVNCDSRVANGFAVFDVADSAVSCSEKCEEDTFKAQKFISPCENSLPAMRELNESGILESFADVSSVLTDSDVSCDLPAGGKLGNVQHRAIDVSGESSFCSAHDASFLKSEVPNDTSSVYTPRKTSDSSAVDHQCLPSDQSFASQQTSATNRSNRHSLALENSSYSDTTFPDMGLNALRGWTSSEQISNIMDSGVMHGRRSKSLLNKLAATSPPKLEEHSKSNVQVSNKVKQKDHNITLKSDLTSSGLTPSIDCSLDEDLSTMSLDMETRARSVSTVTTLSEIEEKPISQKETMSTSTTNSSIYRTPCSSSNYLQQGARPKTWHTNMKYRGPTPRLGMTMSHPKLHQKSPIESQSSHTLSSANLQRRRSSHLATPKEMRPSSAPHTDNESDDQSEYESADDRTPSTEHMSISNLVEWSFAASDSDISFDAFEKYTDWMSRLPRRLSCVPITHLAIPGSHMSLAVDQHMRVDMNFSRCDLDLAKFLQCLPQIRVLDNFRDLVKAVWKLWMPRQMLNITQQLEAGVRYFDMTVTRCHGAFYGEHSLYTKPLRNYLRQMVKFLDAHRGEVILLHFASFARLDHKEKNSLLTIIYQFFGARLCRAGSVSHLTLSELRKHNKQVVLFFPDSDMEHLSNHIFGGLVWSDKVVRAVRPVKKHSNELLMYLHCVYDDDRPYEYLHVHHACVTPDLRGVFCGDYAYRSLKEMVQCEVNASLAEWLVDRPNLNIVCVDFVGCHDITGVIIQLNDTKKAESVV